MERRAQNPRARGMASAREPDSPSQPNCSPAVKGVTSALAKGRGARPLAGGRRPARKRGRVVAASFTDSAGAHSARVGTYVPNNGQRGRTVFLAVAFPFGLF